MAEVQRQIWGRKAASGDDAGAMSVLGSAAVVEISLRSTVAIRASSPDSGPSGNGSNSDLGAFVDWF